MGATFMTRHAANAASEPNPSGSAALARGHASDDGSPFRVPWPVPAGLITLIGLLIASDMWTDATAGTSALHLALEAGALLLALGGLIGIVAHAGVVRRRLSRLGAELHTARADAARWRQEAEVHLKGLAAAIDHQFAEWGLSAAEREVGLLLLKGLSLREIAAARGTSERTVRQQARGIYKKATVAGRAELSAFVLEDLLLPPGAPMDPVGEGRAGPSTGSGHAG